MSKTCSFEGCDKPIMGKGLCAGHYSQQRQGQELRPLRQSKAEADRLRAQGLKQCCDCHQIKPFEEFNRNKSSKDGRNPRCRACQAEYYKANRERILEYSRRYYEANREKILRYKREYSRRYYEANREKMITCSFEGCDKPPRSSKQPLCEGHYAQQRRGQELRPLRQSKAEAERLRAQGLKKCPDCDQIKPFEEFNRNKSSKDGRHPRCRACQAEYYKANRERYLEYFRRYYEANREKALRGKSTHERSET